MGRPVGTTKPDNLTRPIYFRPSRKILDGLDKWAKEETLKRGELIRRIIEGALEKRG